MTLIDKVITEESAKVFNITGIVGYSDFLLEDEHIILTNPIKVFNDDHEVIGFVNLEFGTEDAIIGHFSLNYATPERLNIETGILTYPTCFYRISNKLHTIVGVGLGGKEYTGKVPPLE